MNYKGLLLLLAVLNGHALAQVDLVRVDKSEGRMELMERGAVVRSYSVAFGGNPQGHKRQQGDEKTPEGRYTLDYVKEDSSFYRAMHVSYPNGRDRADAAMRGVLPGGLIMVHGQRNGLGWLAPLMQRFNWTDGCIALTNDEMDEFLTLVSVGTSIEIRW